MASEIISRAEARSQGLTRYFTGKPCKHGHIAERQTCCGLCVECKLSFDSDYYSRNKDKFRKSAARWRNSNREQYRKQRREWAARNRDKTKPYRQSYYQTNKDRLRDSLKEWRSLNPDKVKAQGHRYRKSNPELAKAKYHRWAEKNLDLVRALAHKRRARLLKAEGSHTPSDLKDLLHAQSHRCIYCKADLKTVKKHLDHVLPLALGGTNDKSNLQWLCEGCNLSKGARHPIAYAQELGQLL